jgi:hypothetical protein
MKPSNFGIGMRDCAVTPKVAHQNLQTKLRRRASTDGWVDDPEKPKLT